MRTETMKLPGLLAVESQQCARYTEQTARRRREQVDVIELQCRRHEMNSSKKTGESVQWRTKRAARRVHAIDASVSKKRKRKQPLTYDHLCHKTRLSSQVPKCAGDAFLRVAAALATHYFRSELL
jgi:hypothetical protein